MTSLLGPGEAFAEGQISPPEVLHIPDIPLPSPFRPQQQSVELELTIGADGRVSQQSLLSSAGEPFDSLVLEASQNFLFKPALLNGQAIAVRVPFTYVFQAPLKRGAMTEEAQDRRPLEKGPGYVFSGRLLEKGSRRPEASMPVLLRHLKSQTTREVLSDDEGRFSLSGLQPGAYRVEIFMPGFEPFEKTITVKQAEDTGKPPESERFYLTPSAEGIYQTIVGAPENPRAATQIELKEEELTQVAGTFGDPTRVVTSLPGVARSPLGLGYYAVRGAELDNTGFFIDDHPAVFLYHMLGGPGVIHPLLVQNLMFYPGGYPARYGRYAAGVVALETQDGPKDRWHLDLEADVFRAGAMFSVPFDDQKGVATFSFRRSYYELFLPLISDDIDFSYTDYQARVSYEFSKHLRGRFVALGALDSLGFSGGDEGGIGTSTGLGFHRLNAVLEGEINPSLSFKTSAYWEYDYFDNKTVADGGSPIDVDSSGWMGQLLSYLNWQVRDDFDLELGLDLSMNDLRADLKVPRMRPLGEPNPPLFTPDIQALKLEGPYYSVAPFVTGKLRFSKNLEIIPGIRLNFDHYGDSMKASMDPKLAFRWKVHEDWTLKGMAALAHQPPSVFQFGAPFGDPKMPPVEGFQSSLGFEYKPAKDWLLSLEGFVQTLSNLAQINTQLEASDDGELSRPFWDNSMKGRAYGMELFLRKDFGPLTYGWLSYTLSRSERQDREGQWSSYSMDQNHVLNLAWTFKLPKDWSIGARFQLASGNPYYPVESAHFDADQNRFIPHYSSQSKRLPTYHRLDLRVDKLFRFEEWMMTLYLDIQNLYNSQNPEIPRYSYDYQIKTNDLSLPFLPSLGIRMMF